MKICLEGNSYLNGARNGHLQIAMCAHVLLFGKVGCFHGGHTRTDGGNLKISVIQNHGRKFCQLGSKWPQVLENFINVLL